MQHKNDISTRFCALRDEAFGASAYAHDRMAQELAIYHNVGAYRQGEMLGGQYNPITEQSLNPEIQKGINRLVPAFVEQAARITIAPDKSRELADDNENIEDIKNWTMMMEEVDGEGERLETMVTHNLVYGHAISKIVYDPEYQCVRMISVDPCSIAVDPAATQTNLYNADYLVHSNVHKERYVSRYYPEYDLMGKPLHTPLMKSEIGNDRVLRIDEIWIRRWLAEYMGIKIPKKSKKQIFKVVVIDDEFYNARPSPYNYPDIPYATWRNFPHMRADGQGSAFWGHGYGALAWSQQKFVDEVYSNLILAMRNMGVGGYISKKGAINMNQAIQGMGVNIEVDFDKAGVQSIDEAIKPFAPPVISQVLYNLFEHSLRSIADMMPSLNPVFTGESPHSGASGRAINTLQWAAFNQISNNIRAMNEMRMVRKRIQISHTQQFARRPMAPHLWRRGIDFPDIFRDEARHVGFHLKMPDETSLPNTPVGKLQVVQILAGLGLMMPVDKLIEFAGFDQGYGWSEDTFQQAVDPNMMQGAGAAPNQDVAAGVDPGPL